MKSSFFFDILYSIYNSLKLIIIQSTEQNSQTVSRYLTHLFRQKKLHIFNPPPNNGVIERGVL